MARHFMAALGNSDMERMKYEYNGKSKEFDYVQEAILHYTGGADKITVFLTEAAKKKWVKDGGLKASLEKKYKDAIKEVDIDDGNNDDELMNIFTKIYESIDENDEVIFDITNGFRTLPMLVFTVINYARALKNITVKGIYYGVFIKGNPKEQILDLSIYMDIMETAFAANYFVNYGNARQLQKLADDAKKKYIDEAKGYNAENPMADLEKPISKLNILTECINTCRGKYDEHGKKNEKNSIKTAYDAFKQKSENILGKAVNKKAKPFELIFEYAKKKVDHYFAVEDNDSKKGMATFANEDNDFKIGMATIQWCIDYGLVQQGLTALRETIVTYAYGNILNIKGFDEKKRADVERALTCRAADPDEIKELNKQLRDDKRTVGEKKISLCDIYERTKDKRNDINHFGFRKTPAEFADFENNLKNVYDQFKAYIECQGE